MLFGETWLGMFGFVGLELLCAFHIVSMDYSIQKDGQSTRCCSTAAADAQIPYVQPLCELGCGGDHTGDRSLFLQPVSGMFLDSCVCEMGGSAFLWWWGILGRLTASAGDVVCMWCVAQ